MCVMTGATEPWLAADMQRRAHDSRNAKKQRQGDERKAMNEYREAKRRKKEEKSLKRKQEYAKKQKKGTQNNMAENRSLIPVETGIASGVINPVQTISPQPAPVKPIPARAATYGESLPDALPAVTGTPNAVHYTEEMIERKPFSPASPRRKIGSNADKIFMLKQPELKKYLHRYLISQKYKPVSMDGFVYAEGEIPVLLVAHMDTVHFDSPGVICKGGMYNSIWMSPNGIGGDDRAGVYMVAEIIKTLKCHVLFCEDEETGGVGARKFTKSGILPDVNHIIEFDRMGANDAVFYSCDNTEYTGFIESFGFKFAYGSFSDISTIAPYMGTAAVNLSAGYFNPHTKYESVNFNIVHHNMSRAIAIIKATDRKFTYKTRGYSYERSYYDDDYYNYDKYWGRQAPRSVTPAAGNRPSAASASPARNTVYTYADVYGDEESDFPPQYNKKWTVAKANSDKLIERMDGLSLLLPGMNYATEDFVTPEYVRSLSGLSRISNHPDLSAEQRVFDDKYGLLPLYGEFSKDEQFMTVFEEALCALKEGEFVITNTGIFLDDSEYTFMYDRHGNVFLMEDGLCAGADGVLVAANAYKERGGISPQFEDAESAIFLVSDIYSEFSLMENKEYEPSEADKKLLDRYLDEFGVDFDEDDNNGRHIYGDSPRWAY